MRRALLFLVLVSILISFAYFQTTTPPATTAPTPLFLNVAASFTPVLQNQDWIPVERRFDGVPMMFVPVGCFTMGSENGYEDEKPEHEQCFETPFWIDKYEVTNAQFVAFQGIAARESHWNAPQQPREFITWFEARDFCRLRGGRLPTEKEWEYAARGPNSWIYPWGDKWAAENVAWYENSGMQTVEVGRYPKGASWVGALDMSGSFWEWTTTIYVINVNRDLNFNSPENKIYTYPYTTEDGREIDSNDTQYTRVMRGGSWFEESPYHLRSSIRIMFPPDFSGNFFGFRCIKEQK